MTELDEAKKALQEKDENEKQLKGSGDTRSTPSRDSSIVSSCRNSEEIREVRRSLRKGMSIGQISLRRC